MPDGATFSRSELRVERCTPGHLRDLVTDAPASMLAGLDGSFQEKCANIAWTGVYAGRPVFAAGIIVHWEGAGRDGHPSGFGEAWAVSGSVPVPRRLWPTITRLCRLEIDTVLATRLTLIECTVLDRFSAGRRWARRLGFVETGPRPMWSPLGEDAVLYHRTRGIG